MGKNNVAIYLGFEVKSAELKCTDCTNYHVESLEDNYRYPDCALDDSGYVIYECPECDGKVEERISFQAPCTEGCGTVWFDCYDPEFGSESICECGEGGGPDCGDYLEKEFDKQRKRIESNRKCGE